MGGDGICGSLRAAEPAEACEPIKDRGGRRGAGRKAFVLIARGNCSFEEKVRAAQQAGFDAAVVYDDEEKASLYSSEYHHAILLNPTLGFFAIRLLQLKLWLTEDFRWCSLYSLHSRQTIYLLLQNC